MLDSGFPDPLSMSWVGFRAGSDRDRAMWGLTWAPDVCGSTMTALVAP
jgi:hypothetical protein